MRDLKFRVFIGGQMIVVDESSSYTLTFGNARPSLAMFSNGGEFVCDSTVDEVMQYTGLKDRNGKEIYEGDIVGFGDDSPTFNLGMYGYLGVIRFSNGRYNAQLFDGRKAPVGYDAEFVTVYGNIHENQELVNA